MLDAAIRLRGEPIQPSPKLKGDHLRFRMVTMTPEQRREVALKAAKTRWAKHQRK